MSPEIPVLFAYGTLMEPRLLEGVLGHGLEGLRLTPAAAPGFRTVFYPGRIYPALVRAEGATARGLAVSGLSARDMEILDLFEGDEYVRTALDISLIEGEGLSAGPGRGSSDQNPAFLAMEGRLERVGALYYRPVAEIGADAAEWSFTDWRREHGEAMIVAEGESAAALRAQLIAMGAKGR